MTHHHARLIAVAIATVSFSTPITAQQEPTSPTTLETLVETLGGSLRQNEQGEVVEVYLPGPEVTDARLAHLAGLTALETLILDFTDVTDAGLAYLITGLPALTRLGLTYSEVADAGLVHLTGLTALKELRLDETQVTDAGLAHLTGLTALKDLSLDNTQITDAGVVHLTGLPALRNLGVAHTQVTDAGVAELRKRLPNCVCSGRDAIAPPPPPPQ